MTGGGAARAAGARPLLWWAAVGGGGILLFGLFARIVNFPLRHDEQMYLPAGILFDPETLYRANGFNHLPNLPLLLDAVFRLFAVDHYLFVGRLVICAGWVGILVALMLMSRRSTGSVGIGALGALLLATNAVYVGPAGVLVSNNMLPAPFALFALHFYLGGVDRARPDPARVALAGFLLAVAIGLKANYVFVLPAFGLAAVFAPAALGWRDRLVRLLLPLLAGGIVGGLPSLWFLATDRDGFLAHVVRYHQGPHRAWSRAAGESLVFSPAQKYLLAEEVWLSGASLLAIFAVTVLAGFVVRAHHGISLRRLGSWPILLTAGLIAGGMAVSFLPSPSFPQYYLPPVAFVVVLAILLYGRLSSDDRRGLRPLLGSLVLLSVVIGGPRLLADLPRLASPGRWTGTTTHALANEIGTRVRGQQFGRKVATLSPIYPLEAGLDVYPALAGGPFVYRVAALIPPSDRRHYQLMSETTLAQQLDADPPAAIITGVEGKLDHGFVAYAESRGYRLSRLPNARTRDGELTLYLRPPARANPIAPQ